MLKEKVDGLPRGRGVFFEKFRWAKGRNLALNLPEIEKKWQEKWKETGLYRFDPNSKKKKHYVLEMFSYPSGAKLHIGHWYNYGLSAA